MVSDVAVQHEPVAAMTPMMQQYHAIREQLRAEHPEAILFYRMGDFYELFFDDALKAAAALDIALTKRGKHLGEDIPMCGVPVASYEAYIEKLLRSGFKVAIGEQLEDPAEAKKRGYKAVVKRDVVRVMTPGTLTEDGLLHARRANYLVAVSKLAGGMGLAWVDISTGEFRLKSTDAAMLAADLARLQPGEILVSYKMLEDAGLAAMLEEWGKKITPQPGHWFESEKGARLLQQQFEVGVLDAFGGLERAELGAVGALLEYVGLTQKGSLPRLDRPQREVVGDVMAIDAATRRNLELTETLQGHRTGSLLATVDMSVTGAGGRLLAGLLAAPLTDVAQIGARLDAVDWLKREERTAGMLREALSRLPDVERGLSRVALGRPSPRDLGALRAGLRVSAEVKAMLSAHAMVELPSLIVEQYRGLGDFSGLEALLTRALVEELPALTRDGGFVAKCYSPALDEMRMVRDESKRLIAALQQRYVDETGIATLKIKHNNILGYFIEVSAGQSAKMGPDYIHRQTMAGAVRYTTPQLNELERQIGEAAEKSLAMEQQVFDELVGMVLGQAEGLAGMARALAWLDVWQGLAAVAAKRRYCRPVLDESLVFDVVGGRHPVVEHHVGEARFVANDCRLGERERLWLLTGPNMAGKSTFLRQNALIAILAQVGSFVPAESARIGVVDRCFSRVGAADDLARGRSTFMVEMVETAVILHQATERSLVIQDEIGRGTATYDGLSIAWAVAEHLHHWNRCRGLFATHYHEMVALKSELPNLACYTMQVKEWKGEVKFLHHVVAGAADRSYGIHVAQLAGLPKPVIGRARHILGLLEADEGHSALKKLAQDMPLFAVAGVRREEEAVVEPEADLLREMLEEIQPDELTPKQALELVYRLKGVA